MGLPDGQMGNSEVGPMNIGAGRIMMQLLPKINQAISTDELKNDPKIQDFVATLKASEVIVIFLVLSQMEEFMVT